MQFIEVTSIGGKKHLVPTRSILAIIKEEKFRAVCLENVALQVKETFEELKRMVGDSDG